MEIETKIEFELREERNMKRVPLSSIRKGLFLRTKKGMFRHLLNIIPIECKRCRFPVMEITGEDFRKRTLTSTCPYCGAQKILCLTAYEAS